MSVFEEMVSMIEIPKMIKIKQEFSKSEALNISSEIKKELQKPEIAMRIKKGSRIAITCGSRGISNLPLMLKSLCQELIERGCKPFIIPAMGSHGGATATGQLKVLESLGVTEEAIGVPIYSSMEVINLGKSVNGFNVYYDKYAYEADFTIVLNRIKPHTGFIGDIESGLCKMIAIGLGKQLGAESCHSTNIANFSNVIKEIASFAIMKGNISFGIGIIEDAYDNTSKIMAIPSNNIICQEKILLNESKAQYPSIPFDNFDVLIIKQIGKNIAGIGTDSKITGRYSVDSIKTNAKFQKMVLLSLTEESNGNANGMGIADIITKRLFKQFDPIQTYPNALTSRVTNTVKIPMVLDNDRQAIRAAIKTCVDIDYKNPKIVFIYDTLHISELLISDSLLYQVYGNNRLRICGSRFDLEFDKNGNLF